MDHQVGIYAVALGGILVVVLTLADVAGSGKSAERTMEECPSSPNCASSLSRDPRHAVDPLRYDGRAEKAFDRLKRIVKSVKRSRIVYEDGDYLRVEFRTLLGFVDDGDFLLDRANGVIHMRSASRVGYWDLGLNRRRLEQIGSKFKLAPE